MRPTGDDAKARPGCGDELARVIPIDWVAALVRQMTPESVGSLLTFCPSELPVIVDRRILKIGRAAAPSLMRLLDQTLEHGRECTYHPDATRHAVRFLGRLGESKAIEPMVQLYAVAPVGEPLHSQIFDTLHLFGQAVLEPTLKVWAGTSDRESHRTLAGLLARLAKDQRIFDVLVAHLRADPDFGAVSLTGYGDPRAIPYLEEELDKAEFSASTDFVEDDAAWSIFQALLELGAPLSGPQQWKLARLRRLRDPFWERFRRIARDFLRE